MSETSKPNQWTDKPGPGESPIRLTAGEMIVLFLIVFAGNALALYIGGRLLIANIAGRFSLG